MKTIRFKHLLILICLSISLGAGCDKNDDHDSKTVVIQKEADGIEFKFCLLNEQGKPATIFNKGENFSFSFSVKNKSGKKLYFYPEFAYSNNNFCKVYNDKNQDLGQPFRLITALDVGIGAYPFENRDTYVFEQLWVDDRDFTWDWQKGAYQSTHKDFLPIGDYTTGFKNLFKFTGTPPINIDTLEFKINFKII